MGLWCVVVSHVGCLSVGVVGSSGGRLDILVFQQNLDEALDLCRGVWFCVRVNEFMVACRSGGLLVRLVGSEVEVMCELFVGCGDAHFHRVLLQFCDVAAR